jgi:hypothetical protein
MPALGHIVRIVVSHCSSFSGNRRERANSTFSIMLAAVLPDGLAFRLNGESRQEDWHDAVLAERRPIFGMAGALENELPISALVEKLALGKAPHWKPTKDERTLAETQ